MWNDEKFRKFPDDGKLGFVFLLTHPSMTSVGAMRATLPGLAAELRWSPRRLERALAPALEAGMVEVNREAAFIALPTFLRHNPPENPNVARAWAAALETLPECPEKQALVARCRTALRKESFRRPFEEALAEPFGKGSRKPEPEPEPQPEQEPEEAGGGYGGNHAPEPAERPASSRPAARNPHKAPPKFDVADDNETVSNCEPPRLTVEKVPRAAAAPRVADETEADLEPTSPELEEVPRGAPPSYNDLRTDLRRRRPHLADADIDRLTYEEVERQRTLHASANGALAGAGNARRYGRPSS
jgi:hypothetical protein